MQWLKRGVKLVRFLFKAVFLRLTNRGEIRFLGVADIGYGVTIRVPQGGRLTIGRGCILANNTFIWCSGHLTIGERVFVNRGSYLACMEAMEIADSVMIGDGVSIHDNDHVLDVSEDQPRVDRGFTTAPVKIGKNAWLGSKCTVLQGVEMGSCSVAAAGAVVNRDVEARWIVGGVPARPIRRLGGDVLRRTHDSISEFAGSER